MRQRARKRLTRRIDSRLRWRGGIAANLVAAGFFDIAVRDVVMSLAAFTLARLDEVRDSVPVHEVATSAHRARLPA